MKKLLIVLAVFLMFGAVAAQDDSSSRANTLIVAFGNDIENFNTVTQSLSASSYIESQMFPSLYDVDIDTGLPISTGLTTWEVADDGLTYTFTIRPDANWSDGTPITSADVKFTFDAIAAPNVETVRKSFLEHIDSINVIDDKHFEVKLKDPNCNIWGDLSTLILPASKFKADFSDFTTADFNTKPDISGGPYLLDEWKPDEYVRLKANPTYWKGEPGFKMLVLQVIPDPAVVLQALQSGDVDYASLSPEQATQLDGVENVTLHPLKSNTVTLLGLNLADSATPVSAYDADGKLVEQAPNKFFGDVRVRQAIAMGWDKDAALTLVGEGTSRLVGTISPAISWAFDDSTAPYPYDPEAAAKLLDEAGWTLGDDGVRAKDGTPFAFDLYYIPGSYGSDDIAALIQDQLGQLGIKVSLQSMELGALVTTKMFPQTFDALMIGAGWDVPEPQVLTNLFLNSSQDMVGSGFNFVSYVNPEVDDLLKQAGSNADCSAENRGAIYKQIQKMVHDDAAYDFISDNVLYFAFSSHIDGVVTGNWGFNPVMEWQPAS